MRSDGTHLRRLTPWSLRAGISPDWSPDGRWILFRSNADGGGLDSQLYVIHPDGRGLRAVTDVGADTKLYSASFSPDGRQIVYGTSGLDDLPDLYTVRTDGSRTAPVAVTPGWESSPDWGPAMIDGRSAVKMNRGRLARIAVTLDGRHGPPRLRRPIPRARRRAAPNSSGRPVWWPSGTPVSPARALTPSGPAKTPWRTPGPPERHPRSRASTYD